MYLNSLSSIHFCNLCTKWILRICIFSPFSTCFFLSLFNQFPVCKHLFVIKINLVVNEFPYNNIVKNISHQIDSKNLAVRKIVNISILLFLRIFIIKHFSSNHYQNNNAIITKKQKLVESLFKFLISFEKL